MRLVVHVGMPKAGSTSFQWLLRDRRDDLLHELGLHAEPPGGALNDFALYQHLAAGRLPEALGYLAGKRAAAEVAGRDAVVISSENLFEFDPGKGAFGALLAAARQDFETVTLLLVVRSLPTFMPSYALQLLHNGQLAFQNPWLASWIVGQARAFATAAFPAEVVSFDVATARGALLSALISAVAGREVTTPERIENRTPTLPSLLVAASGATCRLKASEWEVDVNAPEVDAVRRDMRALLERCLSDSAAPQSALHLLTRMSKPLDDAMDSYIRRSIAALPPEWAAFYSDLVDRARTSCPGAEPAPSIGEH